MMLPPTSLPRSLQQSIGSPPTLPVYDTPPVVVRARRRRLLRSLGWRPVATWTAEAENRCDVAAEES